MSGKSTGTRDRTGATRTRVHLWKMGRGEGQGSTRWVTKLALALLTFLTADWLTALLTQTTDGDWLALDRLPAEGRSKG